MKLRSKTKPNEHVASITKQTPWPCGIFDFGKAAVPGVDYFNCGLVQRPDGVWLVARRSQWTKRDELGRNDLIAFLLDGKTPVAGWKVDTQFRFPDEHAEDPRAIFHAGRVFVSCCDFVLNRRGWTGAHQIIVEVDEHWRCMRRYDPVFGKNGGNTGDNQGHEKNWLWFFHDERPHMIYSASPHVVANFNSAFELVGTSESVWDASAWTFGEIRGGTPPVLVDGEYWTFFHSSTPWGKRRQYHMGAYAFEAKPPFRITKITLDPLLSGSKQDRWFEGKPLVVFPCGSLYRDDKWLVSLGVNDLDCGWIEIPHRDLTKKTVTIPTP